MRLPFRSHAVLVTLAASLAFASWAAGATVDLAPSKDNTLIETPVGNSNGAGDGIYVGRIGGIGGGTRRRGVLAFDLSPIPAGATINSVALTLTMAQTNDVTSRIVSLHRLNADWGEAGSLGSGQGGPASPGDATWVHRFFNTQAWTTAGGDFQAVPSAQLSVGNVAGPYTWTGGTLVADVQFWRANPALNFGWLARDPETTTTTSRKYFSSEGFVPPKLTINYTPSTTDVPGSAIAGRVSFAQPSPTPATGRVNLSYTLPHAARVSLSIHDAMGRVVRRLVAGDMRPAGPHVAVWDGSTDSGAQAASGVYVANLVVDTETFQRRIPLLR